MLRRLGYVATALSIDATTSRTCRLRNATPLRLRDLIDANLCALDDIIRFNERERIRLYRISSGLIPFGSHAVNTVRWWEEFADRFREIGRRIRAAGMRVSMHPGQYTLLNSPDPAITAASRADLDYHARVLDLLDVLPEGKLVLHVGGLYGNRPEAIERFIQQVKGLPEHVRRRLVVENDDRLFTTFDVLDVSERTGVPVVFDWLHYQANPGRGLPRDLIAMCFSTWSAAHGFPKVHISSQAADAPVGAHADWVSPNDVLRFMEEAPRVPFDCMLEAKEKDRALLRLRGELAARGVSEEPDATREARRRRPLGRRPAARRA
ncbi:MAG: UV DNA damage repair endonuclease UvsE [Vicinamibacterales bacterium]